MGVGRVLIPAYVHDVKMRIGETVLEAIEAFARWLVPKLKQRTWLFLKSLKRVKSQLSTFTLRFKAWRVNGLCY
jgi:hypothetical protein